MVDSQGPDLDFLFGAEEAPVQSGGGPDLDLLFGPESSEDGAAGTAPQESVACTTKQEASVVRRSAPEPHPALLQAVSNLLTAYAAAAPGSCSSEEVQVAASPSSATQASPKRAKGATSPLVDVTAHVDEAIAAMRQADWPACRSSAEAARATGWDAIIGGIDCKELFMIAQLLLALCASVNGDAVAAVSHADGAFVFAAAGPYRDVALLFVRWHDDDARSQRAAAIATAVAEDDKAAHAMRSSTFGSVAPQWAPAAPDGAISMLRVDRPSEQDMRRLLATRRPFVTSGCLDSWPARERWRNLEYLDRVVGHRIVPLELGSKAGSSDWCEKLMPLDRFLRSYLGPSCAHCADTARSDCPGAFEAGTAYLAQHELLDQCPVLRADVDVPPEWRASLGWPTRVNAWLGTHGTVTPCHWDSYDNCLAQVQGVKRALLLAPEARSHLYTKQAGGSTAAQGNISPVDVEAPDLQKYPDFEGARVEVADLCPGDALFIPQGWWHQIRALSPSFSVNFWF